MPPGDYYPDLPAALKNQLTDGFARLAQKLDRLRTNRRQFVDRSLIEEFNSLSNAAHHAGLIPLLSWPVEAGELEYAVLRAMRLIARRDPDPDPVVFETLISPADFLQKTRKDNLRAGDVDVRGENLQRIDACLLWFHLDCKGPDTYFLDFARSVVRLATATQTYQDGKNRLKTWFESDQSNRRREALDLHRKVHGLRAKLGIAAMLEPWRGISRGGIRFDFPHTQSQAIAWANRDDAPKFAKPVLSRWQKPGASQTPLNTAGAGSNQLTALEKALSVGDNLNTVAEVATTLGGATVAAGSGVWALVRTFVRM